MKILMFGWEFPPYISGGLGTACYGIANSLINRGIDLTFVIPTKKNKDIETNIKMLGADEIPLAGSYIQKKFNKFSERLKICGIDLEQNINPYYTSLHKKQNSKEEEVINFSSIEQLIGKDSSFVSFSGDYSNDLLFEVAKYGIVAGQIALSDDYDLIHAHDWMTYLAGVNAKNMTNKPLIVHVHATEFDRSGDNINTEVFNIEKYGYKNADHIIAVSYYTKNILINKYHIDEKKISVVHNAVNKQKRLERLKVKKPLKEKIVLFLGRITMQKGPDYFIEAANLVLKKLKNVRFVMAGSGDLMPGMITRMAELKIADKFHFTGFLRGIDVEKMYAMSDLYVMPSVSEPFGISPFEAIVYDVPIIISKQSGVSEILKNAFLVDFWDIEKLANTIIQILSNENLSNNIINKCKEEMKYIEWEKSGEIISNIYNKFIS